MVGSGWLSGVIGWLWLVFDFQLTRCKWLSSLSAVGLKKLNLGRLVRLVGVVGGGYEV